MKAHLNPFAPDRVQRLLPFDPLLADSSWETIESKWEKANRRAAIVGHHGSGKSTFLKTFTKRLKNDHQIVSLFFRREDRVLQDRDLAKLRNLPDNKTAIIIVDGEGHLSWSERKRLRYLSKDAFGYLVARHHRCALPTLLHLKSDLSLAETLLQRIGPEEESVAREALPSLLRKKGGNLREVWLSLYDDYACKS